MVRAHRWGLFFSFFFSCPLPSTKDTRIALMAGTKRNHYLRESLSLPPNFFPGFSVPRVAGFGLSSRPSSFFFSLLDGCLTERWRSQGFLLAAGFGRPRHVAIVFSSFFFSFFLGGVQTHDGADPLRVDNSRCRRLFSRRANTSALGGGDGRGPLPSPPPFFVSAPPVTLDGIAIKFFAPFRAADRETFFFFFFFFFFSFPPRQGSAL